MDTSSTHRPIEIVDASGTRIAGPYPTILGAPATIATTLGQASFDARTSRYIVRVRQPWGATLLPVATARPVPPPRRPVVIFVEE